MKKVLLLMVCALMGYALYAQVSNNFSDYTVGGKSAQQAQVMGKDTWLDPLSDVVFKGTRGDVLYSANFDDKPNGSKVAQSYPDWWTTWSVAPGGPEDGTISNEQSASPSQSAKLAWGNDLMFKAGDKTTGAYSYDFDMYIPAGGKSYFNVLHFFDPGNGGQDSEWAVGVYFNVPAGQQMPVGTNVQQNGTLYPFTFPFDTWFPISIYINLDVDLAIIKINNIQVLEWQFSTQESGGAGTKQFGRVDYYPPMSGSVCYIDNVVYAEAGDPPPPAVLSVTPDELTIKLPTNATKAAPFYIVSEETGTQKATWSTYIDYSPLDTGTGPEFTLAHCDIPSAGADGIGYSEAFDREIGMKLKPTFYKEQLGGMLKKIAFYIKVANFPGSNLTFRVYGQGPAENMPGDILAEKVLPMASFIGDAWNWVDIDPLQLTGGEYWVTVAMHQPANVFPLTVDGGPAVEDGDWLKTGDGGWNRMSAGGTLNYNFSIQAKGDGKVSKLWGTLDQAYGTTFSGEKSEIKATVSSAGFADLTTCTANIVVLTNVAAYPSFDIPLTMVVDNEELNTNTNVTEVTVDGTIAPKDESGQYDYRLEGFKTDKGTAEIVVTTEDPKATVTGDIGEQPIKNGANNYTFTVTAEDGTTTREYTLRVMAEIIVPPAISEIDNAVQLYPNPVVDYLYLKSDVAIEKVTIYNLTGKVVKQIEQPGLSIDLSDFASGIYMLRVSSSQGETVKKFIKE